MTARARIKHELETSLTQRELQILGLLHYYGFSGPEVARAYGITKTRVLQINVAAIRKIREIYGRHGLLPEGEGLT